MTSFVSDGAENLAHFASVWTPREQLIGNNFSHQAPLIKTIKKKKKKKDRSFVTIAQKRAWNICTCLLGQKKKKIDRFSELLKGYLKQAEKNTIKRLQYIVASYIVKVPLQCSRSLECQNAGRLWTKSAIWWCIEKRTNRVLQARKVKDCRQKAWRKRLETSSLVTNPALCENEHV